MTEDIASRLPKHNRAEQSILSHIASFRRQYNSLYPRGPLLLLTAKNENHCMKSIISFVVPSLVPYEELLNISSVAQILADLITYLPPSADSHSLPTRLQSPAVVVEEQKGSGAECAIVTASILLGAGYSAFVVQGNALKTLVSADTSSKTCPYLEAEEKVATTPEDTATSKYTVRPPPDMRSKYMLIMEERARRKQALEEDACNKKKKIKKFDAGRRRTESDSLAVLHFWVLVLPPNRGITTPTFVEPTTGQVIPVSYNHPYRCIHAVFNHSNYWASIHYDKSISSDMFNISDHFAWMALLPEFMQPSAKVVKPSSSTKSQTRTDEETPDNADLQSRATQKDTENLAIKELKGERTKKLKVPKTWARPVVIREEALHLRFPNGWREEVYKGVLVRRYSPFTHQRGATLIMTLYNSKDSKIEVREEFQQRQDGLITRITNLVTGAVVEKFAKSRKDTLKCHEYWRSPSSLAERAKDDGMRNPFGASISENKDDASCKERFLFHSKFRVDAVRCRIIGSSKWREEFDERPDLLLARTVNFVSSDPTPPRAIQMIEEEFGCPEDVDPHTAVQKRVFQMFEGRILLVYHYGKHRLLQPTRSFIKPADSRTTTLSPDMTHGFQPDPSVEEVPLPQLWNTLQAEMEAEARVREEVRKGVEETAAIRAARVGEEKRTVLLPDLFDIDKNETVQYILQQRRYQETHRNETEKKKKEEREGKVDTVEPYMPLLLGDDADMGPKMVRERCLQDMRDRLALRANLLQDRLDQARTFVLECRDEVSRRKRVGADERAALAAKVATAEASHRRLRAQLAAWKHEASERYETLIAQLDTNLKLGPGYSHRPSTSVSSIAGDF